MLVTLIKVPGLLGVIQALWERRSLELFAFKHRVVETIRLQLKSPNATVTICVQFERAHPLL